MGKERETAIPVTESSGNVFADLGVPEAEEELTKAQLASHIRQVIKRQRLTQVAAGVRAAQRAPREFFRRPACATVDRARSGCGHHGQSEAAQSRTRPHPCARREARA